MKVVDAPDTGSAIATLRLALDRVFGDPRFFACGSMSASQVADYLWTLVLQGERSLDRLSDSAFERLSVSPPA
jgi:hypothetical protein